MVGDVPHIPLPALQGLWHHVPMGLGCVRGSRVWGTRPMSASSSSLSRPGRRHRGKKASPSRSFDPSTS